MKPRAVNLVIAVAINALFLPSLSAQTNPPYLAQFPSVERVKSEMQGKDAMDTAARQMGAFWQLQEVIKGMSGLRWAQNRLTADEKRLLGQYAGAYQGASQPYANYPNRPAWYQAHAFYETNRDFREEIFRRLLSPAVQAQWAEATGETRARVQASREQRQTPADTPGQSASGIDARKAEELKQDIAAAEEDMKKDRVAQAQRGPARPMPAAANARREPYEYKIDAVHYLGKKNYEKAIEAYRKVIELEPDFDGDGFLVLMGMCDERVCDQRLVAEAESQVGGPWVTVLKAYAPRHPNDAIAFLMLGDAHEMLVFKSEESKTMSPASAQAHHTDALAAYRRAIDLKPASGILANTWFRAGEVYQKMKQDENAVSALTEVVRLQPDNSTAMAQLGHSLYALKRYAGALEAFQKWKRLTPNLTGASFYIGRTLNAMKQHERAVEELRVFATSAHADAHYELGVAYRELGQYPNAISAFQQTLRLKEKNKEPYSEALYGLGLTYLKMGQKDRALQIAGRLQGLDQAKAQQLREISSAAPGAAQTAATKGVDGSKPGGTTAPGDSAAAYVKQGKEYSDKHDYPKAIEAYQRALALDANNADAYFGLGGVLYELKRFAEALDPLQRAVRLRPDDNNALWVLGMTYVELGNKQAALRIYRTLMVRAKDDGEKQDAAELMARMWEKFPELRPK